MRCGWIHKCRTLLGVLSRFPQLSVKNFKTFLLYTCGDVCSSDPTIKGGKHFPILYEKNVKLLLLTHILFVLKVFPFELKILY
jgi:hypothetical protein